MSISTRQRQWSLFLSGGFAAIAFLGAILIVVLPHIPLLTDNVSQHVGLGFTVLVFSGITMRICLQHYLFYEIETQTTPSSQKNKIGMAKQGYATLIFSTLLALSFLAMVGFFAISSHDLAFNIALLLNGLIFVGVMSTMRSAGNLWRIRMQSSPS